MYRYLFATGILNSGAQAPVARYIRRRGDVIVGTELRERVARGHITLTTSRAVAARSDALVLADGTSAAVTSVLWCTSYRPDTAWTGANSNGAPPVPRAATATALQGGQPITIR